MAAEKIFEFSSLKSDEKKSEKVWRCLEMSFLNRHTQEQKLLVQFFWNSVPQSQAWAAWEIVWTAIRVFFTTAISAHEVLTSHEILATKFFYKYQVRNAAFHTMKSCFAWSHTMKSCIRKVAAEVLSSFDSGFDIIETHFVDFPIFASMT